MSLRPAVVVVDPAFSLEAVQAAAYALTGRAYVEIERAKDGGLRVALSAKGGSSADGLAVEFRAELEDQALRLRVACANLKIREYVVTRSLAPERDGAEAPCPDCEAPAPAKPAEAPPLDAELEKEIDKLLAAIEKDGAADPLGVVVPWEEKFGKPDAGEPERERGEPRS